MEITLGDKSHPIVLPPSFALRHEIIAAGATNMPRAACAALGVSVPALRLRARYNFAPLPYGGAVLDELVARGLKADEVFRAAAEVYSLAVDATITDDEVKAAEGNSGGAEEAPATSR